MKKSKVIACALIAFLLLLGLTVYAAPAYEQDGLKLEFVETKEGILIFLVDNRTASELHKAELTFEEFPSHLFTLTSPKISIGHIKAGEKHETDLPYKLSRPSTDSTAIDESVPSDSGISTQESKRHGIDTKTILLIGAPVVVIVAIIGVVLAKKKKRQDGKTHLSIFLIVSLLVTSLFCGMPVEAEPHNIADSGRLFYKIPLEGELILEGETYPYQGVFYYETDRIELNVEETEIEEITEGFKVEADPHMESGKFDASKAGEVGQVEVVRAYTYVNGKKTGEGKEISRKVIKEVVPGVIKYGTKPVTKVLKAKTVYEAVKEKLGYEKAKEGIEPKDGSETIVATDFNLEKMEPVLKTDKVDPVNAVVLKGVLEDMSTSVPFGKVYEANQEAKVGSANQVKSKGVNGSETQHFEHKVDAKTGAIIKSSAPSGRSDKVEPVNQVELVGVLDTIVTSIPFKTETKQDPTKWDNYKSTASKGVNGKKTDTVARYLDTKTGVVSRDNSKAKVLSTKTEDPVNAVTVIGTKAPTWKRVVKTAVPIDFTTTNKVFVSQSEFGSMKSAADVAAKRQAFNAAASGKTSLGANGYAEVVGQKGEKTTSYEQAVDESGNAIPGYAIRNEKTEITKQAVNAVHMYFNVAAGTKRDIPTPYSYRANESLAVGKTNVIQEGAKGAEESILFYAGEVGKSTKTEKWTRTLEPKAGITEVGAREVKTELIPFETEIRQAEWTWWAWDTEIKMIQEGVNGEKITTKIYNVNASTGKLEGVKSSSSNVTKESRKKIIEKGENHFTNNYRTDFENELFRLINEYRASKGIAPLVWGPAEHKKNIKYVAAKISINGFYHVPGGMEDNISRNSHTPQATLNSWKSSGGHERAMVNPDDTYCSIGCYVDSYGGLWWAFGAR